MPKSLADFRAKNLKILQQLCPDDPDYINEWIKQFDERHGINVGRAASKSSSRKAASSKNRRRVRRTFDA